MKTRKFLWGLLACAAFSACSSEEVDKNAQNSEDKAFMKVKIVMAGGNSTSRGTDEGYETTPSSTDEYGISDMLFIFYNDNGDYVTTGNVVTPNVDSSTESNLDAKSGAVISLTLREGDAKPTKVIAYANGGNFAVNNFVGKSLSEAKHFAEIPNSYAEANHFIMTNSTYYDNTESEIITEVAITDNCFKTTENEALNASPINIYLERLAAKVIVSEDADLASHNKEIFGANGNRIKFKITGYLLNGTNSNSYWLKMVDESWFNASSEYLNWAYSDDYRCFWAKDVNYEESASSSSLNFISPNDLNLDAHQSLVNDKQPKFCLENTLSLTSTSTANRFADATHVLVFGKYDFYKKGQDTPESGNPDVFWYGGNAYLTEDLRNLWANNGGVYKKDGESWVKAPVEEYSLVSNGTNDGVTLQFNGLDGVTYTLNKNTSEVLNKVTLNEGYKESFKATGYKYGVGYFPVLIEHLFDDSEEGYGATGELGVVRNHIYKLTINSIENLAKGIFNGSSESPIVPDSKEQTYYLGTTLNILSWKTVSQEVEL